MRHYCNPLPKAVTLDYGGANRVQLGGNTCPVASSDPLTPCPPGFYCPSASGAQIPCPVGSFCGAGSSQPKRCGPTMSCDQIGLVSTPYALVRTVDRAGRLIHAQWSKCNTIQSLNAICQLPTQTQPSPKIWFFVLILSAAAILPLFVWVANRYSGCVTACIIYNTPPLNPSIHHDMAGVGSSGVPCTPKRRNAGKTQPMASSPPSASTTSFFHPPHTTRRRKPTNRLWHELWHELQPMQPHKATTARPSELMGLEEAEAAKMTVSPPVHCTQAGAHGDPGALMAALAVASCVRSPRSTYPRPKLLLHRRWGRGPEHRMQMENG